MLKHAIDFEDVQALFDGRPIVTARSTYVGEARFVTTAESQGRLLTVVWTHRGTARRIISARSARNEERRVRYTAEELAEKRRRGEMKTDWARVDVVTDEELEASIDFEEEGEAAWSTVQVGLPDFITRKVSVPIERDLIAWFAQRPGGIDAGVNKVLRGDAGARQHAEPGER